MTASSILPFWTTAILMNYYREKLINSLVYWILLSIPLVYFLIAYFYQFFIGNLLISYAQVDPVTVSIILGGFLSLSKPIGGLIFGAAFWNISKIVSYEKNIRTYMILSGWGIFLIFATNQAVATVTVLNTAAYLVLLGIYGSATLVSANDTLRKSIRKHALESRLLDLIGHAEMENEIQKTVADIIQSQDSLEMEKPMNIELDEKELKKYIDVVIREVKKEK
jgi:hypothetical protein